MAKVKRVLRCYKCGVVLQSLDVDKKGYIPASVATRETLSTHVLYCQNCFEEMKKLNSGELSKSVDKQTLKILDDAVATDAVIIWVVDLFAFNGTFKMDLVSKLKGLKIMVIGTKYDLFNAKRHSKENFERYLIARFNEVGIEPANVLIIGNDDSYDPKSLVNSIHELRQGHDVYMIGTSMSGKTSLVNRMMKNYENNFRWTIKTEYYPGTTLKVLEIPLSNSSFLYELPGLSLDTSIISKVEKDVQKVITPKKSVKETSIKLSQDEAVFFGGLITVELIRGEATLFKAFTSEYIEYKKVSSNKLDEAFKTNLHSRIIRPVSDSLSSFSDFDLFEYDMEDDNLYHDISVEGFGWVSFIGKGQTIRISFPHGAALKETLSKVY